MTKIYLNGKKYLLNSTDVTPALFLFICLLFFSITCFKIGLGNIYMNIVQGIVNTMIICTFENNFIKFELNVLKKRSNVNGFIQLLVTSVLILISTFITFMDIKYNSFEDKDNNLENFNILSYFYTKLILFYFYFKMIRFIILFSHSFEKIREAQEAQEAQEI